MRPCRRRTMPSKSRCKYCYRRERMRDPTAKSIEIKRRCSNPTNGCVVCKEYVCSQCWSIHVEEIKRNRPNRNSGKRSSSNVQPDDIRSGSVVLESLFATNGENWKNYAETIWGKKCRLFTYDADVTPLAKEASLLSSKDSKPKAKPDSSSIKTTARTRPIRPTRLKVLVPALYGGDGCWRENSMIVFPLKEIIRQSWCILTTFMGASKSSDGTVADRIGNYCHRTMIKVSILRNFRPMTRDEILKECNGDLYSAYLLGCSISWENCELISPHIAALCQDLQGAQDRKGEEERGGAFRQVLATAHLTPPKISETCPARKNDRNIFVFQLVGRRYWKTFWNEPGDEDRSQGSSVTPDANHDRGAEPTTEDPNSFDDYLYPGDILYIPKGMSYLTQSTKTAAPGRSLNGERDPSLSFHVTITVDEIDMTFFEDVIEVSGRESTAPDSSDRPSAVPKPTNRPSTVPDLLTSSNDGTCTIIEGTGKKDSKGICDGDKYTLLSNKRTALLDKTIFSSQCRKRPRLSSKSRPLPPTTMAPSILDAAFDPIETVLGPIAASNISFLTNVRAPTPSERNRRRELPSSSSIRFSETHPREDEKWDTGIRREIRVITKVITNRMQSLAPGYGRPVQSTRHTRVVDLCELVKNTIEEKSELSLVCDLTLLALVKREVEAGNLAVVPSP